MKKRLIKIFSIVLVIMLDIINIVYAQNINDIYDFSNDNGLVRAGQVVAGWIMYVAIIICVIVVMIKGIKFITSAPEGKAEVKKELIPWAIGIIILFSMRIVLNLVIDLTQENIHPITI